jgi:hypothetical protein
MSPLLETYNENNYILVAIDHYSNWVEAHVIVDHTTICKIVTWLLEAYVVCCFDLPKHVLINNGGGEGVSLLKIKMFASYNIIH